MKQRLVIKTGNREQAVQVYRYLQKVLLLKKEDVERVSDASFAIMISRDAGELLIRVLQDKFVPRAAGSDTR